MTITTEQALTAQQHLRLLGERPLPGKMMMKLHKIMSVLTPILEAYDKTREALVKQYGEKDDQDQLVVTDGRVQLTDADTFNEQIREALSEDHSIPTVEIPESLVDGIEITLPQLEALMLFTEEVTDG